jgi:hypothetical protein
MDKKEDNKDEDNEEINEEEDFEFSDKFGVLRKSRNADENKNNNEDNE